MALDVSHGWSLGVGMELGPVCWARWVSRSVFRSQVWFFKSVMLFGTAHKMLEPISHLFWMNTLSFFPQTQVSKGLQDLMTSYFRPNGS